MKCKAAGCWRSALSAVAAVPRETPAAAASSRRLVSGRGGGCAPQRLPVHGRVPETAPTVSPIDRLASS